jgi:fatty acid desaturase
MQSMASEYAGIENHPHRALGGVPIRLDPIRLRELSRIRPRRALSTLFGEWMVLAGAIVLSEIARHPVAYMAAVLVIGARQHALGIIVHDAVHYRFLPEKRWNDWIANLLAGWPTFLPVELFRAAHGPHHRYLGGKRDGNRIAWKTHDPAGALTPEWTYPKSRTGLAWKILRRVLGWTGLFWITRGLRTPATLGWPVAKTVLFIAYYTVALTCVLLAGAERLAFVYWIVPYCTWHIAIQYVRLICEHSGRINDDPAFAGIRSTCPGFLARMLVLPCHVGYHIEHHWYPSVPLYNLPELHRVLAEDPVFQLKANVQRSIGSSLQQCLRIDIQQAGWRLRRISTPSRGH